MKRFESWNNWEAEVNAAWENASLRVKLNLLLSAASLRPSQSTDAQHAKFVSLSRDVELEMKSILGGDDSLDVVAAKLVEI